jgi:hypothetical protein
MNLRCKVKYLTYLLLMEINKLTVTAWASLLARFEGWESVGIAPRASVVELPACAQLSVESITGI